MNLWGGVDELTCLLNEVGTVRSIYEGGSSYGIEFDGDYAQLTRERTEVIFTPEQLQLI